ncbi:MAG: hypothetical protein JW703_03295 [Candidatus Diapherotrites archaeon]|nr:hypothetical protein [Candidatus Diapherotrites archaeon]
MGHRRLVGTTDSSVQRALNSNKKMLAEINHRAFVGALPDTIRTTFSSLSLERQKGFISWFKTASTKKGTFLDLAKKDSETAAYFLDKYIQRIESIPVIKKPTSSNNRMPVFLLRAEELKQQSSKPLQGKLKKHLDEINNLSEQSLAVLSKPNLTEPELVQQVRLCKLLVESMPKKNKFIVPVNLVHLIEKVVERTRLKKGFIAIEAKLTVNLAVEIFQNAVNAKKFDLNSLKKLSK